MTVWVRPALLGLVMALGVGCSSSPHDDQVDDSPAPPAAAAGCMGSLSSIEEVRFGPDNALGGYIVGSGADAVVLAHQSDGDACQMMPLARKLAASGFRVLAYDASGYGSSADSVLDAGHTLSDDAVAAATLMRIHADHVFLVGASMGGYAVLGAALKLQPAPDAVVSLSAPAAYGDGGQEVDVSGLEAPLFLMVARDDSQFVPSNRAFAREDAAATLVVLSGFEHGVDLVTGRVFARIVGFLNAHR